MAAAASLSALDWHAGQDGAAMVAHNRALTARLIAAADDLGLALVTPRAEARRGGSVMLRLPDAARAQNVLSGLRARGLYADTRGALLRLSPGVITTDRATRVLIEALGGLRW
jgi:kynureninase